MTAEISSKVVEVTPTYAMDLLAKNTANRPIRKTRVSTYALMMKRGEWKLNGEPIIVSSDGQLLSGQHRLLAVIQCGVAVPMLVVTGMEASVRDTLDTGISRNIGDSLSVYLNSTGRGYEAKNIAAVAATLCAIRDIINGTVAAIESGNSEQKRRQIGHLYDLYPGVASIVSRVQSTGRKFPIRGSNLCALFYLFFTADPKAAEIFLHQLDTGIGLKKSDPAYLLRERFFSVATSKAQRTSQFVLMAWCINTFNAIKRGEERFLIKHYGGDTLPKVSGYSY